MFAFAVAYEVTTAKKIWYYIFMGYAIHEEGGIMIMNYRFGLDIGIASCGWAVLHMKEGRIVDFGVRLFDKGENPKNGESLNLSRRTARGQRRRLRRRALRLQEIRALFEHLGLENATNNEAFATKLELLSTEKKTVWDLRASALDEHLDPWSWLRVLYHIAKRRGYQSNRRNPTLPDENQQEAEAPDLPEAKKDDEKQKEEKKVLSAIKAIQEKMKTSNYRTIGEMIARHDDYAVYKRNRYGHFHTHINRSDAKNEVQLLFQKQRELGNEFATEEIEEQYVAIAFRQRPFSTRELMEKMRGQCTFEKNEKRAPKNSYTVEQFVLYQKANHIRLWDQGAERILTREQRDLIVQLAQEKKEVTYYDVRKKLELEKHVVFQGIRYDEEKKNTKKNKTVPTTEKPKMETVEKNVKFISLPFYHKIKAIFTDADASNHTDYWGQLCADPVFFDELGELLTMEKDEKALQEQLVKKFHEKNFPEQLIAPLMNTSFSKFGHLSLKAYRAVLFHLKNDVITYDKACEEANYNFRGQTYEKQRLLPPIPVADIRNPVVLRALTQARKVLNAMVRTYGSPDAVHIEVARELSKSFDERNKIQKKQEENREDKETHRLRLKTEFSLQNPKPKDLLKHRLYEEQHGQCLYSGNPIERHRLFEDEYVEIDHIVPMSRTGDDTYTNKALVLKTQNQNKGNRSPFEWFGHDKERWEKFEARAKVKSIPHKKQQNLLCTQVPRSSDNGFRDRHLNDTRFIARYFSNHVQNHLDTNKVVTVKGALTDYLRSRFGLQQLKNREESAAHHALDAILVAVADEKMIQRISQYSKKGELYAVKHKDRYIDPDTGEILDDKYIQTEDSGKHFPTPWEDFRKEVLVRFGIDPRNKDKRNKNDDPTPSAQDPWTLIQELSLNQYHTVTDEKKWIRPLFISRCPDRKVTGKAHEDTVRRSRIDDNNGDITIIKKTLKELVGKKKNFSEKEAADLINTIYGNDPKLKEALKAWLINCENCAQALEKGEYPRKPLKQSKQARNGLGPPIKSVKIMKSNTSGGGVHFEHCKAIANNESMVRVDVFLKDKKYYIVPIYVSDTIKPELPNRAIVAHKSEKDWDNIDESYKFIFSLYKNDLIEVKSKKKTIFGYYVGCHRGTANITVVAHDRVNSEEKDGTGVKTGIISFKKFTVDPLGYYTEIKGEKRIGFSQRTH